MIPQSTPKVNSRRRSKHTFNLAQLEELRGQGLSWGQIAEQLGEHKGSIHHFYMRHHSNGAPKHTTSAPSIPTSAPQSTDLESRVAVLEAYIKALQSRDTLTVHQSASNGAPQPTRKRGFVIRETLSEAIDRFAETYHLEIRAVLDEALCEFFERRGPWD
jgi:hypothetical protein